MAEVKRPLDAKMEGKVPPVEAKAPEGEDDKTGDRPDEDKETEK